MKILLVVTENKECPFLTSPNECKNIYIYLKRSIFAQYTVFVLTYIFSFLNQSFTLASSTIDTIANKMPGPFAPKLWIVCTNTLSSEQKKSEIRPIRPIPNVHAHTIGIVFASSKPIGIEYCFDDV